MQVNKILVFVMCFLILIAAILLLRPAFKRLNHDEGMHPALVAADSARHYSKQAAIYKDSLDLATQKYIEYETLRIANAANLYNKRTSTDSTDSTILARIREDVSAQHRLRQSPRRLDN